MPLMNGHDPLTAAMQQAEQQRAAEQMLRQVLQQALNQPARVTQITGPSLIQVVDNPAGGRVLLVAQVNGERWDIPLDDGTARRIAFALASSGSRDEAEPDAPEDLAA